MQARFYKLKQNKMISGVLAGIADKFGWNLQYLRLLFFVFSVFNPVIGPLVYYLMSHSLSNKDELTRERFGQAPRRIKEAEKIKEKTNWFW